ncbi:hypothetical protein Nepgr_027234 [Nepenthes gracilis]|uniref:Uncharacterized protein n=1 Tax=Nepenthes gracilis TaxID=150966 RepID=A0AAD3TA58_NEPGR|nr:hypothetical protein Nepgr_027234 [Nepenthes gracilis]
MHLCTDVWKLIGISRFLIGLEFLWVLECPYRQLRWSPSSLIRTDCFVEGHIVTVHGLGECGADLEVQIVSDSIQQSGGVADESGEFEVESDWCIAADLCDDLLVG